ncbi:MAG: hypothetical protein JSR34_11095 [Proteobacteria bacterium]|nr:hypothetical protein [Pseudomonadota bacterium]
MNASPEDTRTAERCAVAWLAWCCAPAEPGHLSPSPAAYHEADARDIAATIQRLRASVLPALCVAMNVTADASAKLAGIPCTETARSHRQARTAATRMAEPTAARVAARQEVVAWLEAFVTAVETGLLVPSTSLGLLARAALLDEIWVLRGLTLPALHEVFDIAPWKGGRWLLGD